MLEQEIMKESKDEEWNYGQYVSCNSPSFLPSMFNVFTKASKC